MAAAQPRHALSANAELARAPTGIARLDALQGSMWGCPQDVEHGTSGGGADAVEPFMILPLASNGAGRHEGEGTSDVLGHKALPSITSGEDFAARLSGREKFIVRCLVEGASNKVIARKIDIAEATVKVHIKAILRKIRVQNRTQAAIWAMNHNSSLFNGDSKASGVM
jgi:DNA-binding CsgD family transcriptional regulator